MPLTLNTLRQDTTVLIPSSLPLSVLMDCFHLTLLPEQVCSYTHITPTHTPDVYRLKSNADLIQCECVCMCMCDRLKNVLDGLCASQALCVQNSILTNSLQYSIFFVCLQYTDALHFIQNFWFLKEDSYARRGHIDKKK